MKGWKKIFHTNRDQKKAGVPILISDKIDFKTRDTYRLKVKGWKTIFHRNRDQQKAGVPILISDKIDFKIRTGIGDKEANYIMIKG